MKNDDMWFHVFITSCIIILAIFTLCAVGFTANNAGYNDGYCAAKSGHYNGDGFCNVNQTLVPIP